MNLRALIVVWTCDICWRRKLPSSTNVTCSGLRWNNRVSNLAFNGRGSKSCPNYFFYHYSTIPVPLYSIPTGLCCESPTRNKSEFCISMCESVFECTQVCISLQWASVHHWAQLLGNCWRQRLSQRTPTGSAGDDELEVDEVEMN